MWAILFSILLVMITVNTHADTPSLSSNLAKETIENSWNSYKLEITLGKLNICIDKRNDPDHGVITPAVLEKYRGWEKAGLISIKDIRPDFRAGMPPCIMAGSIFVSSTEKGNSFIKGNSLSIPVGNFTITSIKRNDPVSQLTDYRLVSVLYDVRWSPEAQACYHAMGIPIGNHRKARVLLKYDEFNTIWKVVVEDNEDIDKEFTTNNTEVFIQNNLNRP